MYVFPQIIPKKIKFISKIVQYATIFFKSVCENNFKLASTIPTIQIAKYIDVFILPFNNKLNL